MEQMGEVFEMRGDLRQVVMEALDVTPGGKCSTQGPMARYDFRSPRLFVEQPLAAGGLVSLAPPQAHYLKDVLRLGAGDRVLVFNGRDGEWDGRLAPAGKRGLALQIEAQTRPQAGGGDLDGLALPRSGPGCESLGRDGRRVALPAAPTGL